MRSEQEMMALILGFAREDSRIKAVYMNGSRTNPNAPRDMFQDYDIVYVTDEMEGFTADQSWISYFGNLLMMQQPDALDAGKGLSTDPGRYAFLMLFDDGNRIDLSFQTVDYMQKVYLNDSLTIPLLDKDGILPDIPESTDRDYFVKKPSEGEFDSVTNDFWWCLQNVAKGLWRDELPYAHHMFELTTRSALDQMIEWWIGSQHDYEVSAGKMGKYFKRFLPEEYWTTYLKTYAEDKWAAVDTAAELFGQIGREVAEKEGFQYPERDEKQMLMFVRRVRSLPGDAEAIF
ncbi:aminoglycoside 6-adenylyltransferase [Jeotgalibacillus malaysiensis]|uniref:Aminoglycoside 6-adenylyltransferase n=1 Tax=Jeotgalibacillus malaysiensis TaxID=1508404 RepID=A0A0B5AMN5_9BACL|nr:aminoglycoside 6-adenylyltransferase [Jeotgalibacillus malaysiensis]AJD89798.1 aminoglycoside 6-adenylyltransferase [Jeotgalibacillus malaysiensis]